MDRIDIKILEILAENSNCTASDISTQVNLSIPAVNKRIAKMRDSGVIEKFTIQINPKKINKSVQAFIFLVVDQYSQVHELMDFVSNERDIIDLYAVTGEYDYMIKVCTRDIESLETLLLCLKEKRCVSKSHTMFALMEHKHLSGPLPDGDAKDGA